MKVIDAPNVNYAYNMGMELLASEGVIEESRAGKVLVHPSSVTTVYKNPCERVLFNLARNCNPFFHVMESLWMLAGRNDVEWLAQFNKRMADFSDDGETFHAAYGHRLRRFESHEPDADFEKGLGSWQCVDQLATSIELLKKNPDDRRVVCQIWDPNLDMDVQSRDIPCNDTIKFEIRAGVLNMYVFNRSNDIIWGAYGANAVHFSFIQEYVAGMIGVPVGRYEQISTNYHAYVDVFEQKIDSVQIRDEYSEVLYKPLVDHPESFDRELHEFMGGGSLAAGKNKFFPLVAYPMALAWRAYKNEQYNGALVRLRAMPEDNDWRLAAERWLHNIMSKKGLI